MRSGIHVFERRSDRLLDASLSFGCRQGAGRRSVGPVTALKGRGLGQADAAASAMATPTPTAERPAIIDASRAISRSSSIKLLDMLHSYRTSSRTDHSITCGAWDAPEQCPDWRPFVG
jgi:hypothetical protein